MIEIYNKNFCRSCINEEYDIHLKRKDCIYNAPYPMQCSRCGEVKNIVSDLTLSGKLKTLFVKK